MLYLTTMNKVDSFTAHKVLHSAQAPGGGMFMPMQLPVLDDVALDKFERMSFGEATAAVMNLFFGTKLTGWDVDFAVGRQAVDMLSVGHRVSIVESWHNPAGSHAYFVQRLYNLMLGQKQNSDIPNVWFETAVNISILFGVYGKYCRGDVYEFDVSVEAGDLKLLLAVRYAQKMGLPIRKIILGCADGDGMWDFLSYGDYSSSEKARNPYFEALLWLEFGYGEVASYHSALNQKSIYRLNLVHLDAFRNYLFATVVGSNRAKNVAENAAQTVGYSMQTGTARAFGALQDYRAKTGENKNTLLFAQNASAR